MNFSKKDEVIVIIKILNPYMKYYKTTKFKIVQPRVLILTTEFSYKFQHIYKGLTKGFYSGIIKCKGVRYILSKERVLGVVVIHYSD